MALDLADRHAARVEAEEYLVKAVEPGLALGDQQRLQAAGPVARHRDVDPTIIGQDGLRAGAVAAVAAAAAGQIALLVAEMFALSSAPSARSISAFFNCLKSPSAPIRSSGFS